eukprot:g20802.t1
MGKKLVILSNSSKRSPWVLKEIPKLGLDAAAFLGAITSGEEAWKALRERSGQRCVWLSKVDGSGVTDYLEGTGVSLADVDEADFILNEETSGVLPTARPYTELFKLAISRGLPMICANPDFRSPAKPGKRQEYCAGYVAQHYEELRVSMACPKTLLAFPSSAFFRRSLQGLVIFLPSAGLQSQELGGVVQYFGKPHSPHFEAARRFLGDVAACHVGDSMIHDVAGARAAALPVVFVAGGIEHQETGDLKRWGTWRFCGSQKGKQDVKKRVAYQELGIEPGQTPTPDALLRLAERYGIQPDHVVPLAMWN